MRNLFTLLLAASATVTHAQVTMTSGVQQDRVSIGIDKYEIVRDGDDFDAWSVSARARLSGGLSVTASYADATSDLFTLTPGVDVELDATRFSVGLEYDLTAGPGIATFSLAYANTSAEASGTAAGDAFDNGQVVIGARYRYDLSRQFALTFAATHFVNNLDVESGFSTALARTALSQRYEDSPTSFGVSLSYSPAEYVTLHLTYATEDALLGLGEADNTVSFGVRANF